MSFVVRRLYIGCATGSPCQSCTAAQPASLQRSGPLAVAVTVDDSWYSYSAGVFSSSTCATEINHAVIIVGAGVDAETSTPRVVLAHSQLLGQWLG